MVVKVFDSESSIGYKQKTTFFMDFSIADNYGVNQIKSTYNKIFNEWKDNYEYLTELVMVLNWKIWEHYETKVLFAECYQKLWEQTDAYACENLKGEALEYFYRTVD